MGTGGGPRQPVNNSDLAQSDVEAVLATDEAKQRLINEQLAITGVLALQGVDVEDISDPEVEVSQEDGVDYNINFSIAGINLNDLGEIARLELENAISAFYSDALGVFATRFTVTLSQGSVVVNIKVNTKEDEAEAEETTEPEAEEEETPAPPVERFNVTYLGAGERDVTDNQGQNLTSVDFTEERKALIEQALSKWNNIITSMPGGDETRQIAISAASMPFPLDKLGTARPLLININNNNFDNPYYKGYTTSGEISMNSEVGVETEEQKRQYEETVFHEIGHVLGIGAFWLDSNNNPDTTILKEATGNMPAGNTTELILTRIAGQDIVTTQTGEDNGVQRQQYLYRGASALEVYQFFNAEEGETYKKPVDDGVEIDTKYSNTEFSDSPKYFGIPIEDGRQGLQIGGHLLEGGDANALGQPCCLANTVTVINQPEDILGGDNFSDVTYGSLNNEVMSGQAGAAGTVEPISAITLGLVEDLGYGVDWTKCEPYRLNQ